MDLVDIITPTFNPGPIVRQCHSSIADQGTGITHWVQDGASPNSSGLDLLQNTNAVIERCRDTGMYQALNRAIESTTNAIVGHLNADEQYLPGAIARVRELFDAYPDVDVVCGDVVVTNLRWQPLAYRRACLPPPGLANAIPLSIPTCSLFVRRRLLDQGIRYREDLKVCADAFFVQALIGAGAKWFFDRRPYSVFALHRENLSGTIAAAEDIALVGKDIGSLSMHVARVWHWLRKMSNGAYRFRKVQIDVFANPGDIRRTTISRDRLGWRWPITDEL